MPRLEKLNGTLQENVICLLAHSDEQGKIIANTIAIELFEGEYRTIAERCVEYWQRHGRAPGYHTADLVSDILSDKNNRRAPTFRRILSSMMELSEHVNTAYVMSQLHAFTRMQRIKDAIIKSADQLNANEEVAVAEVEQIWTSLLHDRTIEFDAGLTLRDYAKLLKYLETQYSEFFTAIPQFNQRRIVPSRGAVMLFLAPAKGGKSWFLCDVGRRAIQQRKRVVHISLEMSEEECLQRYYQNLFAVAVSDGEEHKVSEFDIDGEGHLIGWNAGTVEPDFVLRSPYIREELQAHVDSLGGKADLVRIKRFPPRSITMAQLEAYLDNLEVTEGFIPDMLILDYIGITKTDAQNHRITLGRALEDFRGLCVRRNLAGVTAHQISREGANSMTVSATHVAEDWSLIATADIVLVFSRTEAEKRLKLGRLFVTQARGASDGWGVIVSQSYPTGQFALDSVLLDSSSYFDLLKDAADSGDDDDGQYDDNNN